MPFKLRGKKLIVLLGAILLVMGVLTGPADAAALQANLNGAGATFPYPVYVNWIGVFQRSNPGVKINYQGVGSGAGISQFTKQTTDFGASDAFMKPTEIAAALKARPSATKVLQIPTVFGAIDIAYNVPGVSHLKLDSNTLANIYLGKITMWNNAAIKALNPGVNLPALAIRTVHRSDSSGTTNAFTTYLATVNAAWKAGPGVGKSVKWVGGVGGSGNAGVAAIVKQTKGSIGYVEQAYAMSARLTVASMKNRSGRFIAPSLASTTAAASGIRIPANFDLLPLVCNSSSASAYPIVSSTYLLSYDKWPNAQKAAAFKAWVNWSLGTAGTSIAKTDGYAPLPTALKTAVLKQVALIH